jgi:hypothetical protein
MQDKRSGLSSGVCGANGRAEPAAGRSVSEATRTRIKDQLIHKRDGLRRDLADLNYLRAAPNEVMRRRLSLAAKLSRVEKALRDLRQMRLL